MSEPFLREFKADGEDSTANDPVTPAGGSPRGKNRPADKLMNVDPAADKVADIAPKGQADTSPNLLQPSVKKAPARQADKAAMAEAVVSLFDGHDLSEDFKVKAQTIFEAAVHERVSAELVQIEENYAAQLDEAVAEAQASITEQLDKYLSYVVERWVEDNQIAIERGIRTTVSESFMKGLSSLLEEHGVAVALDDIDAVEAIVEQNTKLEAELANNIQKINALKEQLDAQHTKAIVEGAAKGLTDLEAERLRGLCESITFVNSEDFASKVQSIREGFFSKSVKVLGEAVDPTDPQETPKSTSFADPVMSHYVEAISKAARKI